MNSDEILVLGLLLGVLAVPALFSANVEGTSPRFGMILAIVGASLIALAVSDKPSGYKIGDVPTVVYRVIGSLIH